MLILGHAAVFLVFDVTILNLAVTKNCDGRAPFYLFRLMKVACIFLLKVGYIFFSFELMLVDPDK